MVLGSATQIGKQCVGGNTISVHGWSLVVTGLILNVTGMKALCARSPIQVLLVKLRHDNIIKNDVINLQDISSIAFGVKTPFLPNRIFNPKLRNLDTI